MDVRRPRSRRWRRPAAAAHWSRRRRILSCNRARRQDEWRQADTPNGELFTKTDSETHEVTIYHYDALGNLLSVDLPDGRLVEYVIDGQNRRIGKKIDGVLTKAWLYQNQLSPIAELDGSGNLTARYVYGSKPNTPDVVMKYSGGLVTTYRVITDHLGSPVMAVNVNNSSDVPFNAEYSTFGERTVSSGAASEGWLPFGFAGGLYDADTGLTRFGARDYDPVVGRWVSKDPILFDGGQTNLFVYVGNDPVNYIDPLGLVLQMQQNDAFGAWLRSAADTWFAIAGENWMNDDRLAAVGPAIMGALSEAVPFAMQILAMAVGSGGARAGYNGYQGPARITPRMTRGCGPGVSVEFPDKSILDVTPNRVKEFVPNMHPKAPPGTPQRVRFDDALQGTKGFKRAPTPEDLEWLL